MPVRRSIHPLGTPSRSAIESLATTVAGSATPSPAMPEVRTAGPAIDTDLAKASEAFGTSVSIRGASKSTPATSASVAKTVSRAASASSGGSCMGGLRSGVARHEALEHAARASVDEVSRAERVELGHHVAPAHRADQGARELSRKVLERLGAVAGHHRDGGQLPVDLGERRAERLFGGGDSGRVEGARDVEHESLEAFAARKRRQRTDRVA